MKLCFILNVVSLLSIFLGIECITWKACSGSQKGKVVSVAVSGCDQTPVCSLKRGQNATFSIGFVINEDASSATAVVHGIIEHVPVPFPLDNPDACKNSGLDCPLTNSTTYKYTNSVFVKTSYPSIRLVVRYELVDPSKNDIICIELPAEIDAQKKNDNNLRFVQHL